MIQAVRVSVRGAGFLADLLARLLRTAGARPRSPASRRRVAPARRTAASDRPPDDERDRRRRCGDYQRVLVREELTLEGDRLAARERARGSEGTRPFDARGFEGSTPYILISRRFLRRSRRRTSSGRAPAPRSLASCRATRTGCLSGSRYSATYTGSRVSRVNSDVAVTKPSDPTPTRSRRVDPPAHRWSTPASAMRATHPRRGSLRREPDRERERSPLGRCRGGG